MPYANRKTALELSRARDKRRLVGCDQVLDDSLESMNGGKHAKFAEARQSLGTCSRGLCQGRSKNKVDDLLLATLF